MAHHISDRSRRYSLFALDELKKIKEKYPSAPKINSLDDEKISWLNERIRTFHESVVKTNYKRFSFLNESRVVRNAIAHSTAELSKDDLESIWKKFFSFSNNAEAELQLNVEKSYSENKQIRKFEKFGSPKFGDEIERKRLAQSIFDSMDSSTLQEEKLPFSENLSASEAEKFLHTENQSQKDLLDFAKEHSEISEQIQVEILETLTSAYDETEITNPENPFYDENLFVQKISALSDEDLLKNLAEQKTELLKTKSGKDNFCNFDFYRKQYNEILKQTQNDTKKASVIKQSRNHEFEILSRNLKSDLQKSLTERYTAWQLEQIDKKRRAYLAELYKKIEQFKKLEELLNPFIKKFGRLWDLSAGSFDDYGFEILKDFADLLENDESLKELADLIGRQEAEKEIFEKELREKTEIKTEYHPKPAYRGQISGLRLSGEISSALPTELAMSKNPATKLYFSQKFAEKKLLSYAYINRQKSYRTETTTEEIEVAKKETEQKGPVIICVDTSGSMHGTPECVAKTITFALAKKCLEEERKCFLISFSTGFKEVDLGSFSKSNALHNLVDFLRMSFYGGNDDTGLEYALKVLERENYKNADILVISDFIYPDYDENLISEIRKRQDEKTKFYSLVIGETGNKNAISCFDENWQYDTNARDSMRHLVRQMHKIGEET
jgi:uncharacterized protein with von Willebrand factor type A (vWA) domain